MADAIQKIEPQETAVAPMVAMIERIAMNPDLPIDRLEQMLAMKERMDAQEAEQQFNAAFAAASAEIPSIPLNGKGHNGRPYATLKDIVAKTRPTLAGHGLSLSWDVATADGKVTVTAILSHVGGHTRRSEIILPADTSGSKNPVQAIGSTQTYGQRYTAQAILGLSLGDDVEDDGAGGSGATVTDEQQATLRDLLAQSGADEGKFLAYFRVEDLADLPAKAYANADAMLRRKIAEAAQ
jgi:hypothetical protein